VLARETTRETKQRMGTVTLLAQDEQGRFELCGSAPSRFRVWLEREEQPPQAPEQPLLGDSRGATVTQRLSADTEIEFEHPGAQDPIEFRPLEGMQLVLHCVNVPTSGQIEVTIYSPSASAASQTFACEGADIDREFTLTTGDELQLVLRPGTGPGQKSGWTRRIPFGERREVTVDLKGGERRLLLACPEIELGEREGSIGLLRCDGTTVLIDQTVVVLTRGGAAETSVFIPNGRWLFRYDDPEMPSIWGVVDVEAAGAPGEELVLRPRVRMATAAEVGAGIRFDEIAGISLANLPERMRVLNLGGRTGPIALPKEAKISALDEPK
jgi:hypothetical protein